VTTERDEEQAMGSSRQGAHIYLHVGTMKSGSSYLQHTLRGNEPALAGAGILAMTRLLRPFGEVRGRPGKRWPNAFKGQWRQLLETLDAWDGSRAILSEEFLASATRAEAIRVWDGLTENHDVTIVITARDLLRNIPSHWQTSVRSGSQLSFGDFVRAVLAPVGPETPKVVTKFWKAHDLAKIVHTWAEVAGADNVVLITVPPTTGPTNELWRRFAGVVGIDPDAFEADPTETSNVSLTYSQVEMLRTVNTMVEDQLSVLEYRALVWRRLASKMLQKGPYQGDPTDRPRLGAASHAKVVERVDAMLTALTGEQIRIVGDIEELRVPAYSGAGPSVESDAEPDEYSPPGSPALVAASYPISRLLLQVAELRRLLNAVKEGTMGLDELDAMNFDDAAPPGGPSSATAEPTSAGSDEVD
jgi:hypothetical protein